MCHLLDPYRATTLHVICSSIFNLTCLKLPQASTICLTVPRWLSAAGERCFLFDWLCCTPVYGVPMNHESKTEGFLFFVFQSVSQNNTANMKSLPPPPPIRSTLHDGRNNICESLPLSQSARQRFTYLLSTQGQTDNLTLELNNIYQMLKLFYRR
jgi:hypothetical protein